MKQLLRLWHRSGGVYRVILTNASSLVGTTGVTSVIGILYWFLAARAFSPDAVGLATVAVSSMTLLATISVMGFGTLLVGQFPFYPQAEWSLISTAALVTGGVGVTTGAAFAIVAAHISVDLHPLSQSAATVLLFAVGVSATTLTLVLDQALVGLFRGGLQFARNVLFSLLKLGLLLYASLMIGYKGGLILYATWVFASVLSIAALVVVVVRETHRRHYRPQWQIVRQLGRAAVAHHALNLALQAPSLVLPLLVTAVLTTKYNASFYMAWMIAGFAFIGPRALTTMLYATGASDPATLPAKVRFTFRSGVALGIVSTVALFVIAGLVLQVFGRTYVEQAGTALRILGISVFPLIVRDHFVAISRIHKRIARATWFVGVGGLIEIGLAAASALVFGSLTALCVGWLVGTCIEAVYMGSTVYRSMIPPLHQNMHIPPKEPVSALGG